MKNSGPLTVLTESQRHRLAVLEEVIKENLAAFLRVGFALREIRERRLYVETHDTFDRYLKKVWDLNPRKAQRLIKSAYVYDNISQNATHGSHSEILLITDGTEPPEIVINERQARELATIDNPRLQLEAWNRANERFPGQVTAARLKKIVKEVKVENVGEAARRAVEIGSGAVKPDPEEKTPGSSWDQEFRDAFRVFGGHVYRVYKNGWKGCDRGDLLRSLRTLYHMVERPGDADAFDTGEDTDPFMMRQPDRVKLQNAGFRIVREDLNAYAVNEMTEAGGWRRIAGPFDRRQDTFDAVEELLRDAKTVRG